MTPILFMVLALLPALLHSSLTSLTMSNAAYLSVILQRTMKWLEFVDIKGHFVYLPQVACHLPSPKVHLFSPQVFHQNFQGKSIVFRDQVEIHLTNPNCIDIPTDVFESNVPIVQNLRCTKAEKKKYGISLMPFFIELLLSKKPLTISSLLTLRSAGLVLPSTSIHLDLRKNFYNFSWSLFGLKITSYWSWRNFDE